MDPISMVFTLAAVGIGAVITAGLQKKQQQPSSSSSDANGDGSGSGEDGSGGPLMPPPTDPRVLQTLTEQQETMTMLHAQVRQLRGVIAVLGGTLLVGVSLATIVLVRRLISRHRRLGASSSQAMDMRCPRIPLEELDMHEYIGHGAFGNVRRAVYNGQEVAVKRIREVLNRGVESEIAIMVNLQNHRHIVPLLGIADESTELELSRPFLIIMEYERFGSLDQYVSEHPAGLATVVNILRQVSDGMQYCHSQAVPIIHRDLGARNVFVHAVEPEVHVKIGDFGLSRLTLAAYTSPSTEVPWRWLGPDSLRGGKYTQASDVWMFAVLVWEIFEASKEHQPVIPWAGEDFTPRFIDRLMHGERLERPAGCSDALWNLVSRCWALDVHSRPPFSEITHELSTMKA